MVQGELLVEGRADLEGGRRGGTDAWQHGLGGQGPGQAGVGVAAVALQVRRGQEGAQAGVGRRSLRGHRVHGLLGRDHLGRWGGLGAFRLPLVGRALWENRPWVREEGRVVICPQAPLLPGQAAGTRAGAQFAETSTWSLC